MEPTKSDVHQDAILSNVSIKYANGDAIADIVMPRVKVDNPLDLDVDTTENITDALIRDREKRVADMLFSTSYVTNYTTLTGSDQWSDYAGSDPIGDIETGMQSVREACGRTPNTIVMGRQVMSELRNHPDLLERIKYTQKGVVTADLLSSLIEGNPRVVVGDLMYDSSQEGGDESLGYIWGKKVLIAYIEQSPSLRSMSLAYQFYSKDRITKQWREDKIDADRVQVQEVSDEKLVSADCGYLIEDAVA